MHQRQWLIQPEAAAVVPFQKTTSCSMSSDQYHPGSGYVAHKRLPRVSSFDHGERVVSLLWKEKLSRVWFSRVTRITKGVAFIGAIRTNWGLVFCPVRRTDWGLVLFAERRTASCLVLAHTKTAMLLFPGRKAPEPYTAPGFCLLQISSMDPARRDIIKARSNQAIIYEATGAKGSRV